MKKLISIIMAAVIIVGMLPVFAVAATTFSDVPKDAWYKNDLDFITNDSRKILEGYKGKFDPNGPLTVAQFVKIAIVTSNLMVAGTAPKQKWYVPYINKALQIGYIRNGEFKNYEKTITRGEMARILIRELESQPTKPTYRDQAKFRAIIKDYKKFPANLRDYIVKTYDLGLIGGYTDGTFGYNDNFTRAQAVAVVRRLLDPSKRLKVDIDNYIQKATVTVEGVKFNPYTDTTGMFDDMKLDKVQDFAMIFFNKLQFYTKDGKAYIKGYIPKVPEGYSFDVNLLITSTSSKLVNILSGSKADEKTLPNQGSFDQPIMIYQDKKFIPMDRKKVSEMYLIVDVSKEDQFSTDGKFTLSYPEKELFKVGYQVPRVKITVPKEVFARW